MDKLHLYNTLSRKLEEFTPIIPGKVTLYTCGPTVYNDAHIGNMKIYIEWDVLTRTLQYLGYEVTRVMNVTDVGQMTSDEDLGEDKMMKAVKREREKGREMSAQDIADLYTELFLKDMDALNINRPSVISAATRHIPEMITMISKLEEKGYAYRTEHAVYFDVSKFPEYSKLSGQKTEDKRVGVRDEVVVDPGKRHPADFRLWQLDQEAVMEWDSPWGKGFPGWHIECSAMATKYLGETIDIHTGGVDHIPVHHTNEIAQSEAASGKPFAHYWLHGEFLKVDNKKMAKSQGNFYILKDVIAKGFSPLDFRYFALQAHYRYPQNFSWEAMAAAHEARMLLKEQVGKLQSQIIGEADKKVVSDYSEKFASFLKNDINVSGGLGVLWEVIKDKHLSAVDIIAIIEDFDKVLGLNLVEMNEFSPEIYTLIAERDSAKKMKDFTRSDEIRNLLTQKGVRIIDTPTGSVPVKE
jgi:cysteinyl-tRNA synthetase